MGVTIGEKWTTREPPGVATRRSVETELAVGPAEGEAGIVRATEIVLGRATVVVLEFSDGITSIGRQIRGQFSTQDQATAAAIVDGITSTMRLRAKWRAETEAPRQNPRPDQ